MHPAFARQLQTCTSTAFTMPAVFKQVCATARASQGKWIVMIYRNAKSRLECFTLQDFKQMAAVGSTDNVSEAFTYRVQ